MLSVFSLPSTMNISPNSTSTLLTVTPLLLVHCLNVPSSEKHHAKSTFFYTFLPYVVFICLFTIAFLQNT